MSPSLFVRCDVRRVPCSLLQTTCAFVIQYVTYSSHTRYTEESVGNASLGGRLATSSSHTVLQAPWSRDQRLSSKRPSRPRKWPKHSTPRWAPAHDPRALPAPSQTRLKKTQSLRIARAFQKEKTSCRGRPMKAHAHPCLKPLMICTLPRSPYARQHRAPDLPDNHPGLGLPQPCAPLQSLPSALRTSARKAKPARLKAASTSPSRHQPHQHLTATLVPAPQDAHHRGAPQGG